jgi:hypothetical protein
MSGKYPISALYVGNTVANVIAMSKANLLSQFAVE